MHRFTFSRILELATSGVVAALLGFVFSGECFALAMPQDYCRGGRPLRTLSLYYRARIPRPPAGTPLDVALRSEQREVEKIREQAKAAFQIQPPKLLASMMESYTFLVPESHNDSYGLGSLVGMSEISSALRYRKLLWKHFIEQSTTVREAPSEDPNVLRFEVSLDLSFFCRYRQRTQDLVTQR